MSSNLHRPQTTTPTTAGRRDDEFAVLTSPRSLGLTLPQRLGRALWLPMLATALMGFTAALVAGIVRADAIATGGSPTTIAALGHLVPGLMFMGFAAVFAAISFAIARILGAFRNGGGEVQETLTAQVQTLRRPWTATAFITGMVMAMMILVIAVVLHLVAAAAIAGGSASALASAEEWAIQLEAARRIGVATYLLSIVLGLASIVTVLRFQAVRLHEIAAGTPAAPQTAAG